MVTKSTSTFCHQSESTKIDRGVDFVDRTVDFVEVDEGTKGTLGNDTSRPMLGMLIFPNLGEGVPLYMVEDIGGVRHRA